MLLKSGPKGSDKWSFSLHHRLHSSGLKTWKSRQLVTLATLYGYFGYFGYFCGYFGKLLSLVYVAILAIFYGYFGLQHWRNKNLILPQCVSAALLLLWQKGKISGEDFYILSRCQFPSGALTGNLNVDHAMCVLSLNIINDKIFLMEWIWFYILAMITTGSLLCSAILVLMPISRKLWLK